MATEALMGTQNRMPKPTSLNLNLTETRDNNEMNPSRAVLAGSHSLCYLNHGSGYFDAITPEKTTMPAIVNAKQAYMRSDGRFFVSADTVTGEVNRGDKLLVPTLEADSIQLEIDRIYYVATNDGAQQSLVFKKIEPETEAILMRLVGADCVLTIEP